MAVCVVEGFEQVDVCHQEAERLPVAKRPLDLAVEALEEGALVNASSEPVCLREPYEIGPQGSLYALEARPIRCPSKGQSDHSCDKCSQQKEAADRFVCDVGIG